MAFMGFPTIYGSYETVSAKIDEVAEETGGGGRHAVQLGRLCGQYPRFRRKRSNHAWRASR